MDHLQEAFWDSSLIGHNWQEPVVHQFPSPIHCVHFTFLSNPNHDLEVNSLAVVEDSVGGRRSGVTNDLAVTIFLQKNVVAQGGK